MALNFPNNPSVNDIYEDSATGFSYQWDGTIWKTYVANKLSFNENDYIKAGSTGNINSTGIITATSFVKSSGTSSQFLKADGSVDSSTYITSSEAGISSVFDDTTPQLGGDLDTNGNDITFGTDKAIFNSDSTFQIYADGTAYIQNTGGQIRMNSSSSMLFWNNSNGEDYAKFKQNAEVELYYDGSQKFETSSTGVTITGTAVATGFATASGTSSQFLKADGSIDSSTYITSADGGNADQLDGQEGTYYLNYNNFTNTPTIPTNNNELTNGANYITASSNISGTAAGLSGSPSITVTDITAVGNVSIAGTLTYEDVTSVDSVGLITARTGVRVTTGGVDISNGGLNVTGVSTFSSSATFAGQVSLGTVTGNTALVAINDDSVNTTIYSRNNNGSGDVFGGFGPGSNTVPTSTINADGSATFAGTVKQGTFNGGQTTTSGSVLVDGGGVYTQVLPSTTASSTSVFRGYHGSNQNITIYADGSAEFGRQVISNRYSQDSGLSVNYNGTDYGYALYDQTQLYAGIGVDGSATFAGNVSIADKIVHTGDTNTAIRFPAADTFTVETAGTERLRVNSSGYVGVNTDSPGRQLTVSGSASEGVIQITNNTSGGTAGNGFELLHFTSGETQLLNRENADMRFDTNNTERLRIDSSGFITQKFTSNNSTTAEGLFINNLNNGTGNNASLIFSNDSGERKKAAIALIDTGNYGAGDLVFALDSADSGELHLTNDEKLRIDSSGVVRVGGTSTYNSSDKLTLVNNSGNCSLTIDSTSSGESSVFFADGPTGNEAYRGYLQYQHSSDALLIGTAGIERMRITSGGDVTIGNSSVAFPSGGGLQVYDASNPRIKLANSTTGVTSTDGTNLYLSGSDFIIDNKESGNILLYTAATERLRIGSAGQIGLSGANYGTSGQVFTSNGSSSAPTWQDAGGGAWNLLSTVTASGASTVDFTSNIDSTYKTYKVIGSNVTMSGGTWIWLVQFYDNGTLVTGSKYRNISNSEYFNTNGTAQQVHAGFNGQTSARLNYSIYAGTGNFEMTLYDPSRSSTVYNAGVLFYSANTSNPVVLAENNSLSMYDTSAFTNISGIRFSGWSGATISGTYKLYGLS